MKLLKVMLALIFRTITEYGTLILYNLNNPSLDVKSMIVFYTHLCILTSNNEEGGYLNNSTRERYWNPRMRWKVTNVVHWTCPIT